MNEDDYETFASYSGRGPRWAPRWFTRWLVGPDKWKLLESGHTVTVPISINLIVLRLDGSFTIAPKEAEHGR
jgi:hypothetical protein